MSENTRELFYNAMLEAHGQSPEEMDGQLKTASVVAEHGHAVMRKLAAFYEDILAGCEDTSKSASRFLFRELKGLDKWYPAQKRAMDTANEALWEHMEMEKQAIGGPLGWLAGLLGSTGANIFESGAKGVALTAATLAGIGALGGGVAHHMGKDISEEQLKNQKIKAQIAEYDNLARALDRKIHSREFDRIREK